MDTSGLGLSTVYTEPCDSQKVSLGYCLLCNSLYWGSDEGLCVKIDMVQLLSNCDRVAVIPKVFPRQSKQPQHNFDGLGFRV